MPESCGYAGQRNSYVKMFLDNWRMMQIPSNGFGLLYGVGMWIFFLRCSGL